MPRNSTSAAAAGGRPWSEPAMASVLLHLVIFHLVEHWRRTYFNQFRKPLTKVDQIIYSLARLYPSQKSCNAEFLELTITELFALCFHNSS